MQKGLKLSYDTLDNWSDFLKSDAKSSVCQIVAKNGKGKLETFILAALSPFLGDLLSDLPPYMNGCIILPDFDWTDIFQFLNSISQSGETFQLSKQLAGVLGIDLCPDNKPSMDHDSENVESYLPKEDHFVNNNDLI